MNRQLQELAAANVKNRIQMLAKAIKSHDGIPQLFLSSCKSQVQFCKLNLPDHDIAPIARNTLYRYLPFEYPQIADSVSHFNSLIRKIYSEFLENSSTKSKGSIKKNRISDLEQRITITESHSLLKSRAYLHLTQQIGHLLNDEHIEPRTKKLLSNIMNTHKSQYSSLFSPTIVLVK